MALTEPGTSRTAGRRAGASRAAGCRAGAPTSKTKSHRVPVWARWLLVFAWVLFIWSRSLFPGPESTAQSSAVVDILRPAFEALGVTDANLMSFLVRKAAHFLEYALLGALLGSTPEEVRPGWRQVVPGVIAPSADETLQRFVPGRSGQLSDVALDCAGVAFGMLVATGIRSARRRCRR